jgi:hypothetical protein
MASRIPLLCLLGLLLVASPAIADDSGIYYQLALLVRTGASYFFTHTHYMYFCTVSIISLIEIGLTIRLIQL